MFKKLLAIIRGDEKKMEQSKERLDRAYSLFMNELRIIEDVCKDMHADLNTKEIKAITHEHH